MLVSKKQQQTVLTQPEAIGSNGQGIAVHTTRGVKVTMAEAYEINPMEDALLAIADIINKYLLVSQEGDLYVRRTNEAVSPDYFKPLFRTIQVENGLIDRLIHTKENKEYVVPLPGIFHHFVDMHWDVGNNTIGTCKATYRMKVVLNNLNIEDQDTQMYCYKVAQAIIRCLAIHTAEYSAFTTRFQLDYFDLMETWTKGIQYFWLQYMITFRDYTAYRFRDYIEKHVVAPPYTNHSDQEPESNEQKHSDHKEVTYDDLSNYIVPDGVEEIPLQT